MNAIATAIDPARLPANTGSGHPEPYRSQVLPRSAVPAVYLEISNRDEADVAHYPDVDLVWNAPGSKGGYSRKNGNPY